MSGKPVITFRGSFAPLMSAIKIGPDVTRLTIDVPKSEQLNAIGLNDQTDARADQELAQRDGGLSWPLRAKHARLRGTAIVR